MVFRNNVYRYWKIIRQDLHKYITSEERDSLSTQKLPNCEIEYNLFCCPCFTESLCLDIKNKKNVLEKLYLLVRTLMMNDDNEEKCYGISADFIRKLKEFFIIICEKASTNIPLSKRYHFLKSAILTCIYRPMYLQFDDYPPYYD